MRYILVPILYRSQNTNTFKCPCLLAILKFQDVLTEKIEGEIHVNKGGSVSNLQHTVFS